MTGIDCRGGHTQISKVLSHARTEHKTKKINAMVYVGDAMEEDIDRLAQKAGELGLLGCPMFLFQEGHDARGRKRVPRICAPDQGRLCPLRCRCRRQELAALLRAVAAYASGGRNGAEAAGDAAGAALLLEQLAMIWLLRRHRRSLGLAYLSSLFMPGRIRKLVRALRWARGRSHRIAALAVPRRARRDWCRHAFRRWRAPAS